jgi:hypothetical protein
MLGRCVWPTHLLGPTLFSENMASAHLPSTLWCGVGTLEYSAACAHLTSRQAAQSRTRVCLACASILSAGLHMLAIDLKATYCLTP